MKRSVFALAIFALSFSTIACDEDEDFYYPGKDKGYTLVNGAPWNAQGVASCKTNAKVGYCEDNMVFDCDGNFVEDCNANGYMCGLNGKNVNGCLAPCGGAGEFCHANEVCVTYQGRKGCYSSCGSIDDRGACDGDVLNVCVLSEDDIPKSFLLKIDCTDSGNYDLVCGVKKESARGEYTCKSRRE